MLGTSLLCKQAHAERSPTAGSLQAGLGFRYGLDLRDREFNPWGPGLGVNVGYTLDSSVYLGGNFDYFFGSHQDAEDLDVSSSLWLLMAEGGYDIGLGGNTALRPKLGAGFGSLSGELCSGLVVSGNRCSERSDRSLALAPGATFLLMRPHFSLTLDGRYARVFTEENLSALIFSVGIGF